MMEQEQSPLADGVSTASKVRRDETVWDSLWSRRSIGRIAVAVLPAKERIERCVEACEERVPKERPDSTRGDAERWRQALVLSWADLEARRQLPGDAVPVLNVPRFTHGQSQGICDVFGAQVEAMEDGNFFVHPLQPDPTKVQGLIPRPIETSRYWGAVEYVRYARAATGGRFPFRNPVMVGPLDTANYLLGTQTLMEWMHLEPEALHALLGRIADVILGMLRAWGEASGGLMMTHHLSCMRGGFDLCSECRSLVSQEMYEAFEAPYLRRLGESLGPYGIHSCGSWERTVPSALADPILRAMNGQVRENDLGLLCELVDGRLALSIGPSVHVHDRYTWRSRKDYFTYILATVPRSQPLELSVSEDELDLWNGLCIQLGKAHNCVGRRVS